MGRINNQITGFLTNWFGKIRLVKPKEQDQIGFNERYRNFSNFIFLWKDSFEREAITTNNELVFSNYFGFGSHIDFIKRLIGKPASAFENKDLNIVILMYTINIKGHKVQFELHFFDQKLFCINYTYKQIKQSDKHEIVKSLLEKYNLSGSIDIQGKIIIDSYGNGLVFEDNGDFSVNYLSPNSQVQQISQAWASVQRQVV
ncbi:MAG: hypothetical protein JNM67_09145 [Bacteroidetes bacterium]|nr:hypothetical protein [Bacteroidota bacterium]